MFTCSQNKLRSPTAETVFSDEKGFEVQSAGLNNDAEIPLKSSIINPAVRGSRRTHQMDPANAQEAIREVTMDVEEGADIIMVKPALAYLDIICRVRQEIDFPVAAYNVSGEYSMIKAAEANGWLDGKKVMMETLTAIKRAGADMILTYFAIDAAREIG